MTLSTRHPGYHADCGPADVDGHGSRLIYVPDDGDDWQRVFEERFFAALHRRRQQLLAACDRLDRASSEDVATLAGVGGAVLGAFQEAKGSTR